MITYSPKEIGQQKEQEGVGLEVTGKWGRWWTKCETWEEAIKEKFHMLGGVSIP